LGNRTHDCYGRGSSGDYNADHNAYYADFTAYDHADDRGNHSVDDYTYYSDNHNTDNSSDDSSDDRAYNSADAVAAVERAFSPRCGQIRHREPRQLVNPR